MNLPIRARPLPLVLLPSCSRRLGAHDFQVVREPYLDALRQVDCLPVVLPAAPLAEWERMLDHASGVLLTGSPSNVHPAHYGEPVHNPSLPLDARRDSTTLALIPHLLRRGVPLLAICRGLQEVNVALGGSLQQAVHERPGQQDHRGSDAEGAAAMFAPAHPVVLTRGGLLHRLSGKLQARVNSVHGQAVQDLAPGLSVEARADDGVIEAFSQADAPGFNLCVQWHPEWQAQQEPLAREIFQAFARACREYQAERLMASC